MYKMSAKPAIPTSATVDPIDISYTNSATHVYIKVEDPKGLSPKWEGPYLITSRPSRSQVEVIIGKYSNGQDRKLTYHWSCCKIAHMRSDASAASRPALGRPPTKAKMAGEAQGQASPGDTTSLLEVSPTTDEPVPEPPRPTDNNNKQTSPQSSPQPPQGRQIRSTRNQNPRYRD